MKLKTAAKRSVVIAAILLLSVLCGVLYHVIGHRVDLANHPLGYEEIVNRYAEEYGVPNSLLNACILKMSNFQSNYVSEDGRVGLMQMTSSEFRSVAMLLRETAEDGLLYDPDTNIRYGAYRLGRFYTKYNDWMTVLAVVRKGESTVSLWLEDPANTGGESYLTSIPDADTARWVGEILDARNMYQKLYDSNATN